MMYKLQGIAVRTKVVKLLFLFFLLSLNVNATESIENYQKLKDLQHLNTDSSRSFVNQLLLKIPNNDYKFLHAPIYAYIAKLKTADGNWLEGKHYLDLAISALATTSDDELLIESLESISWIFFIRGHYSDAIFYVQKMADLAFETANQRGQVVALNRLALSYIELKLFELAVEPLEIALELARATKNYDSEFLATLYLINARIELSGFDPQETFALTLIAERIPSKFNSDDGYLPRLKGVVSLQLRNFLAAEKWLKVALEKATEKHDVRLLQMVSKSLSEYYLATNKPWLALDYASASLNYNNQLQHLNDQASLHYLLSNIYQQLGDEISSLKYLRAYADFQYSTSDNTTVSLLTTMDKRIEAIKQKQKLAEQENSLLANKVTAQEYENELQFFVFTILGLMLLIVSFIVVFVVHHRMLKAQITLSMKDELTGAYCRNYLKGYLPAVKSRFERNSDRDHSLGALIIDCDDFKFINDTFGHAGGDKALKEIVDTLSKHIREQDLLLRWGGDEFVIVCESVNQLQIRELAKRITASISDMQIQYDDITLTVTVSIGYALHSKADNFNFDGLIKAADEFLMATKKSGKNSCLGENFNEMSIDGFSANFSKGDF